MTMISLGTYSWFSWPILAIYNANEKSQNEKNMQKTNSTHARKNEHLEKK